MERETMWSQIANEAAILKLLAEIRQLTHFPEAARRGIGFTAKIEKPGKTSPFELDFQCGHNS
jgi:hypothetical protein